jgi:ABC-type molybdate transport system ATPase subunit
VALRKNYGKFELNVEFSLTAKHCGIFGPSGSGKSTRNINVRPE